MWFPLVSLALAALMGIQPEARDIRPQVVQLNGVAACPMPVYVPRRVPYMPVAPLPPDPVGPAWTYSECLNPLFPQPRAPAEIGTVEIVPLGDDYILVTWRDRQGLVRVRLLRVT